MHFGENVPTVATAVPALAEKLKGLEKQKSHKWSNQTKNWKAHQTTLRL